MQFDTSIAPFGFIYLLLVVHCYCISFSSCTLSQGSIDLHILVAFLLVAYCVKENTAAILYSSFVFPPSQGTVRNPQRLTAPLTG